MLNVQWARRSRTQDRAGEDGQHDEPHANGDQEVSAPPSHDVAGHAYRAQRFAAQCRNQQRGCDEQREEDDGGYGEPQDRLVGPYDDALDCQTGKQRPGSPEAGKQIPESIGEVGAGLVGCPSRVQHPRR
jgi:hypothetical protein